MLNEFTDTDIPDKIQDVTQVIDNLLTIRAHINKFGITPQFLHLVDDNKQLSNSLKIDLEDFNDRETATAAIVGNIKKAIIWLKELFKNLGKHIVDFFKFLFNETEELKANFQRSLKYLEDNKKMDTSHLLDKLKVEQYPLDKLIGIGEDLASAIEKLNELKLDSSAPYFIDENDTSSLDILNNGMRYFNTKLEDGKLVHGIKYTDELLKEKVEGSYRKLEYTHEKLLAKKSAIENFFKTLEEAKKYEKQFKDQQKVVLDDINDRNNIDKKQKKETATTLGKYVTDLVKILKQLISALLKIIRIYCTMCMKMPKDNAKPKKKENNDAF